MTLADILIPLAGSISNEKALKMREACDLLESRVDINQRGTNHAHDLISLLTDRVKELERDNLDRRLTKLERAVDVLDRQRVETLNLRVNGLEHTKDRHKRILEFIEYECVSPLEDRVSKLESATKNTGEGSTSQTGAVSHSQSGGGSDGTREPARSARIDDRDSMLERVDRIARLDAEVAQLDRNLQAEVVARVKAHCTCTHEKRMHANALNGCLVSGCRCEKYTGEGRAEGARSDDVAGPSTQPVQASPTGVREGVSVVDEGPVASRQAAPSPASPSPDEVEALARELQRAWHAGSGGPASEWSGGYLAEARYVLSRYEPRGARASASAVPMTHPASKTLNECREVFRRVTKRGPCLSSPDLHGIAAVRDFLTLSPEKFRENWGPRDEGDDEKCEGGEDPHGASAKNTGEGEVEHAASVSRSVSAKDASRATTPNNAEEGASAMRHGSGARPDATSLSTACPLCHGMLSEDECKKQNTPSPQGSTASAERSVRVDVVHANDGTPLMAAAHVAQPLTGGEGVPAWVPSVEEIQQFIDDGREGDLRALIASRAPAQPSVEEMAERLRVARNAWAGYAPGVVISPSDCWLALDRAAIGGGG